MTATSDNVQFVIKNDGNVPVSDEFWVDAYIDPDPVPTAVNQIWPDLADQGLVWGVTVDALPALVPGGVLTLTVGDAYYWPDSSQVSWAAAHRQFHLRSRGLGQRRLQLRWGVGAPRDQRRGAQRIGNVTSTLNNLGLPYFSAGDQARPALLGDLPARP